MSGRRREDGDTAGEAGAAPGRSEFSAGAEALSRMATGIAARLLGPRAVRRDTMPETPAISPEIDQAIGAAGDALGRLLHATGEAMKHHPADPAGVAREAQAHLNDPVEVPEGWSPLSVGVRSMGGGLLKVTEGVLDVVAPRRQKPEMPE